VKNNRIGVEGTKYLANALQTNRVTVFSSQFSYVYSVFHT